MGIGIRCVARGLLVCGTVLWLCACNGDTDFPPNNQTLSPERFSFWYQKVEGRYVTNQAGQRDLLYSIKIKERNSTRPCRTLNVDWTGLLDFMVLPAQPRNPRTLELCLTKFSVDWSDPSLRTTRFEASSNNQGRTVLLWVTGAQTTSLGVFLTGIDFPHIGPFPQDSTGEVIDGVTYFTNSGSIGDPRSTTLTLNRDRWVPKTDRGSRFTFVLDILSRNVGRTGIGWASGTFQFIATPQNATNDQELLLVRRGKFGMVPDYKF